MSTFEKITGFVVAFGTLLTAAASLMKEYNNSKHDKKEEDNKG